MPDRKQQVIEALTNLVRVDHGGDFRAAFNYYDTDQDGEISLAELTELFVRAGVGSRWTRTIWGRETIKKLDVNRNGKIAWAEFEKELVPEKHRSKGRK